MDFRLGLGKDQSARMRGILVATACVIIAVSWLCMAVDGIVEGNWMQLFWQFLLAMMALECWHDHRGKPSMPGDTPSQRLASEAITLVIGIGGGAMVVTQEALPGRISRGILIAVALCFEEV